MAAFPALLSALSILLGAGAQRGTSCGEHSSLEKRTECYQALKPDAARRERARLEAWLRGHQNDHRARLALAVLATGDPPRAHRLFREAIRGLAASGDAASEVPARTAYARFLVKAYRFDEAVRELERAEGVAVRAASRNPRYEGLRRQSRLDLARRLLEDGDFGRAERLFRLLEDEVGAKGSARQRAQLYAGLSSILERQGLYAKAATLTRRTIRIAEALGDIDLIAESRDRLLDLEWEELFRAKVDPRPKLVGEALARLRWAEAHGGPRHLVAALSDMGDFFSGARASAYWKRCAELSRKARLFRDYTYCVVRAALEILPRHPARTRRELSTLKRYVERLVHTKVPMVESARVVEAWHTGPRARALKISLEYLDLLERKRNLRPDDPVRAQAFGQIAGEAFYWISGMLLQQRLVRPRREQPPVEDIALAFRIIERLRAGQLLDVLTRAGAARQIAAQHPLSRRRAKVQAAIAAAQRKLLNSPPRERARLIERVASLEARERYLRLELARRSSSYARFRPAKVAGIRDVQGVLRPDQALVAFQIANDKNSTGFDAGDSWVTVITRAGARVHPLPERREIEPRVRLYLGLLRTRGPGEPAAAAGLYRGLLAAALKPLPASIRELVVVPDGALHHLPLGALRPAKRAPPIATRFRISMVPSATLWHRWRTLTKPGPHRPAGALVFADPAFIGHAGGELAAVSFVRSWELSTGQRLGRLPHAREEGREVVRTFEPTGRLLFGLRASEKALKGSDLSGVGLLHFASHALIDLDQPERSGLLLAPGSENEDGFVQALEVAQLSLGGKVVVLSGCQTAAETVIRGEGPMGLGRAFFQAGAVAVVATLWKVVDAEIAWLMTRMYRHLAAGASLAAAAAQAQRDAIGAGLPAASWASLVVLGDGSVRPHPAGGTPKRWLWALPGGGLFLLFAGLALWRRRSRRRSP